MDKKKQVKKALNKKQNDNFKKQYFDYYDDIKSSTHKIVDW